MRKKVIIISAICISIITIASIVFLSLFSLPEEKAVTKKPTLNEEEHEREKDVISESSKESTFTEPSVKEAKDKTATVNETEHTVSQSKETPNETLPAESLTKTPTSPDNSSSHKEAPSTPATDNNVSKEPEPVEEQPPMAAADDCVAIADAIICYINSYRSTPASKLPGLTKYAEYRSRQLVSNFAHDTFDERAAATALRYGTYTDPSLYGMTGEPYYSAGAAEAIAMGGHVGTVDYIAKKMVELVKGSPSHWAYVGSSEYCYIAVGVTYENGMWYCDIAMTTEDTDNK